MDSVYRVEFRRPRTFWACLLALPLLAAAPSQADISVPPGFTIASLSPQLQFTLPTCLAFLPDGRLLVGEKRGRVYLVTDGVRAPAPLWQSEDEVLATGDCGLVSIAVDPRFAVNHYVYLLYTVDPDSSGATDIGEVGFGRLVRYRMSTTDSTALDPDSRAVLFGTDWPHGPLVSASMHTVGSLRFGNDGSLLVSIGDGSTAARVDSGGCGMCPDGYDTELFGDTRTDPGEDVGAFRAQYAYSLCGKILRIDPETGHGLTDNPWFDGNVTSVASRVWASGFRNPFRFAVRPGTGGVTQHDPGTLYVGDVGWVSWEEIDVAHKGENFGWPCFEGPADNIGYQELTRPRATCRSLDSGTLDFPRVYWPHEDSTLSFPPGILGNCAIGGAFYGGDRYPEAYRGRYFFADYGKDWLYTATFDPLNRLTGWESFATQLGGPTDFAIDPRTGDLCYVAINDGRVRRIAFTGMGNRAPVAVAATASPDTGRAPFVVRFSSAGSFDPEGGSLRYRWAFGDRSSSDDPSPEHLYQRRGRFDAVLSVTDSLGAEGLDTVTVTISGPRRFPGTPVLDDFDRASGPMGGSWSDERGSRAIADSAVVVSDDAAVSAIWNGQRFGPDEEVHVALRALAPAARGYGLLLKAPDVSAAGGIEVRYDPFESRAIVSTYDPGAGWRIEGAIDSVVYGPGDVFGARAYHDGVVQVFRNRDYLGQIVVPDWSGNAAGGRLGWEVEDAPGSVLDDFGGGDLVSLPSTAPVAIIVTPRDSSFYAAGDTVYLAGGAEGDVDTSSTLRFRWQVDTHHNNHVHPGSFTSTQRNDFMIGRNHDDGTGVFLRVGLVATNAGFSDSTFADVFPEIDLSPSAVTVDSAAAGSRRLEYRFSIYNHGRMPAPSSRWVLRADEIQVARGDTLVPAGDSVRVVCTAPLLPAGIHTLRVTVDSLRTVVETDETNNSSTRPTIGTGDAMPPRFVAFPTVMARSLNARVSWKTNERAHGTIYYGQLQAPPDSIVTRSDSTAHSVLLRNLTPDAMYYCRVRVTDAAGNSRFAMSDSFHTVPGPALNGDSLEFQISAAYPTPSRGAVQFAIHLPSSSRVRVEVLDLQGRVVWARDRSYRSGSWTLAWPGLRADGAPARPGLYWARIDLEHHVFVRRLLLVP